jgi:multidrug efflux pump subunit AcrA (membrane-fusion protein)
VSATGQLQVNEDATWHVGTVTDGKIIATHVRVGDQVQKGQILAMVHSHEVHDARALYRRAVVELGQLETSAAQALIMRDRTRRLFDLRAASREQLEAAEAQHKKATSAVTAAKGEVDKAVIHLTDYLEVPLEVPPEHAGSTHRDAVTVRSPASGTIMERKVSEGTVVSSGDSLFTVANLSSLWLIAAVNEADMARVTPGQRVELTVRAFADRKFTGRVLQLGERLDANTRTLQVRVLVPNPQGHLKPEMFATAKFAGVAKRSVILLPEAAVQELNGKQIVFVQSAAGAFVPQEVRTGFTAEGKVEVLAGLEPGTSVVVSGAFLLKSELLKSEN